MPSQICRLRSPQPPPTPPTSAAKSEDSEFRQTGVQILALPSTGCDFGQVALPLCTFYLTIKWDPYPHGPNCTGNGPGGQTFSKNHVRGS